MESAVFAMRGGLEAFRKLGFKPKEIRLIGGGSKSRLWRQIAADILNLPVKLPVSDEAAALGAAVQALWCYKNLSGEKVSIAKLCAEHVLIDSENIVSPKPENIKQYDADYADYIKNLNAVMPMYV